MGTKLNNYLIETNRRFAINFPCTLIGAIALWYISDSSWWMVLAAGAAFEAMAKTYEIWKNKRSY